MSFSKTPQPDNGTKAYKYKTRKEHVRLKILDDTNVSYNDSSLEEKLPIYDGQTKTDPFGSYTGVCANPYEVPVQDVDDL